MCLEHGLGLKWYLQPKNYQPSKANLKFIEEFFLNLEQVFTKKGKEKAEFLKNLVKNHRGQVVPLEDAIKVIKTAEEVYGDSFVAAAGYCPCRKIVRGEWLPVCIGWGVLISKSTEAGFHSQIPDEWKRYKVASGFIKEKIRYPISADEIAELMREWEEKYNLIHGVYTFGVPYVGSICNCELPYCYAFKDRFTYGVKEVVFKSEYVAQVDPDLCVGCGKCATRCQFGAIHVSRKTGKAYIDPTKCFGCGVCRVACEQKAIKLVDREKISVAKNLW